MKKASLSSLLLLARHRFLCAALLSLGAEELFPVFEEHVAFNVQSEIEMKNEFFLHGIEFTERDPSDFRVIVVFIELIIDIFDSDYERNENDSN